MYGGRVLTLTFVLAGLLMARTSKADDGADKKPEATPATEAAPAAAPTSQSVYLHVAAPKAVTVERQDTGEVVCSAPCDTKVTGGNVRYKVGAKGSPSFVLTPNQDNRADVRVKPANTTMFWVGVGTASAGALLLGGGIATLIYGVSNRPAVPGADSETTDNTFTDTMSIGTGLSIAGVVAGIYGVVTILANNHTKVRGDVTTADSQKAVPSTKVASTSSASPISLPRTTYVPLVGGTF